MIVEAFKDTLELGLEKPAQIVVSIGFYSTWLSRLLDSPFHLSDHNCLATNLYYG
jgi:hypothetical protein